LSRRSPGLAFVSSVVNVYGISSTVAFPVLNFMAVNDYLAWSIRFLTPTIFGFALALILEVFLRRTEGGLSEKEIAELASDPEKTRRRRRRPWVFMAIVCAAAAAINTLGYAAGLNSRTYLFEVYRATVPILWYVLASWYMQVPRLTQNWTRITVLLFYFVPALLLYSYFDGLHSGSRFYDDNRNRFELIEATRADPEEVRVLLVLDKYVLLSYSGDSCISVVPAQDVQRLNGK
jgi:hypothetical protein